MFQEFQCRRPTLGNEQHFGGFAWAHFSFIPSCSSGSTPGCSQTDPASFIDLIRAAAMGEAERGSCCCFSRPAVHRLAVRRPAAHSLAVAVVIGLRSSCSCLSSACCSHFDHLRCTCLRNCC